ncbi:MAG: hypothetical protein U0804_20930 [Gemmataceae bacterium]
MSFDLTVRADEECSGIADAGPLREFIAALPHIRNLGTDLFVLDDPPARWMNIDLSVKEADGGFTAPSELGKSDVNCVWFHIPWDQLGDEPGCDYYPTAWAVAQFLGWRLYDEQLGEFVADGEIPSRERTLFGQQVKRALGLE